MIFPMEREGSFIAKLAKEQKDISEVVNALLFKDKELIDLMSAR